MTAAVTWVPGEGRFSRLTVARLGQLVLGVGKTGVARKGSNGRLGSTLVEAGSHITSSESSARVECIRQGLALPEATMEPEPVQEAPRERRRPELPFSVQQKTDKGWLEIGEARKVTGFLSRLPKLGAGSFQLVRRSDEVVLAEVSVREED
jgi:hypothetical protein